MAQEAGLEVGVINAITTLFYPTVRNRYRTIAIFQWENFLIARDIYVQS